MREVATRLVREAERLEQLAAQIGGFVERAPVETQDRLTMHAAEAHGLTDDDRMNVMVEHARQHREYSQTGIPGRKEYQHDVADLYLSIDEDVDTNNPDEQFESVGLNAVTQEPPEPPAGSVQARTDGHPVSTEPEVFGSASAPKDAELYFDGPHDHCVVGIRHFHPYNSHTLWTAALPSPVRFKREYVVTIWTEEDTEEQSDRVLHERLDPDEDYGFEYTIEYRPADEVL